MKPIVAAVSLLTSFLAVHACGADRQVKLSVYHDDFALVKEERRLDLKGGVNEFRFTDVAATIEPTSVRFVSLDDPQTRVVEQNFEFDLVGAGKLLEKHIGQAIEIVTKKGELVSGTLLRAEKQRIVIKTGAELRILLTDAVQSVRLEKLPQGLLTKPTLVWQIYAAKSGPQKIRLEYLAKAVKWTVAYNAVLADDEKTIALDGWVNLENKSGVAYGDAGITLIAGEPNRGKAQLVGVGIEYLRALSELAPTTQRGRELSEAFGEYRLYRLERPTTLADSEIKQVRLLQAADVPVDKLYLYDGAAVSFNPFTVYNDPGFGREENTKVNVLVAVENRADRHLGIDLPQGKVRIFKRDTDKSLEFVGEDLLPSTAPDERMLIYIGDAFDLTGARTQTDFRRVSERTAEEAFEITLKNHKDAPVTIMIIEKLYRSRDWKILESSRDYKKLDARTIRFDVGIEPNAKQTVTYRVRYTW